MSIEKITDAEIAEASVSRLPDRPHRGAAGTPPLSAEELKRAFDALGRLNAEKYNALVDAVKNGTLADVLLVSEGETLLDLSEKASFLSARADMLSAKTNELTDKANVTTENLLAVTNEFIAHRDDTSLHKSEADTVGKDVRWYTNTEYNALSDRDSRPPLLYHVKMQWGSNPYQVHGGFASVQMNRGLLTELSGNVLRLYTFGIYHQGEVHMSGDTVTMYSITMNDNGTLSVAKEIIVLWGYWVEVLA